MFCNISEFFDYIIFFIFPSKKPLLSTSEVCPPISSNIIYTAEFCKKLEVLNTIWDEIFYHKLELDEIIQECYGIHECTNDKDIVISCCYYYIKQHPDTQLPSLFLHGLATHPDYRNQGAASSIINSIIKIYGHKFSIVLFVDKPDDDFLEGTLDGPLTEEELEEGIKFIEKENAEVRKIVQFYLNRGFYELPGSDFRRFSQFRVFGLQYDHPKINDE